MGHLRNKRNRGGILTHQFSSAKGGTSRTARVRTFGENLFVVLIVMDPILSGVGASGNPGAVQFIKSYSTATEARDGIGSYLGLYNSERTHQALDYRTPNEVFDAGESQWICGQSAAPTGSASPMFPPALAAVAPSEHGNMGKCSPLPTYPLAQPQQEGLDLNAGKKVVVSERAQPVSQRIGTQAPGGTLS